MSVQAPRVDALCRVARLRTASAERRLIANRRAEEVAAAELRKAEERLESHTARLPALRERVYRAHAKTALTKGGVDLLMEALKAIDDQTDAMMSVVEALRVRLEAAQQARREGQATFRKALAVARRRDLLDARLAAEERDRKAWQEELEREEQIR